MTRLEAFLHQGYLTFPAEAPVLDWAAAVIPIAKGAVKDPANAHWLRCGGTWFVGVDALPNDAQGRIGDGPTLGGAAMDLIGGGLEFLLPLHRAQISVCYPGYPQPSSDESEAAFAFRLKRDAAHVDGLLAAGPEKRRSLKEPHAYVLGIGLTDQPPGAAPLTVWEGSHLLMRDMFRRVLAGHPPETWPGIDLTAAYQDARRQVFSTCRRITLPSGTGESVLLHRHLVHGMAPWDVGTDASPEGRMIAYFRPVFPNFADWLSAP